MSKPLVVVTGASHGIGRAVAARFAAEGHPLLLVARHPEPLDGIPVERIRQATVDVADYVALEYAIREVEAVYSPTECLVNNAGFLRIGGLQGRNVADMSYQIDVLFKGVLHGICVVLPGMIARKSGTIVNVSSIADRTPGPDGEAYHASKAAVRSLQRPLRQRGINHRPGRLLRRGDEHFHVPRIARFAAPSLANAPAC